MLTLFTTPKAFHGRTAALQRNAIRSWSRLRPGCEIILFGGDPGVAETAAELGLRHAPDLAQNEYGAPLLSDLFAQAKTLARTPLLGYVNSDIILMDDFMAALQEVQARFSRFLMIGQRLDVEVEGELSFDGGWQERLRRLGAEKGNLYPGIDYFVFPTGLWSEIPPFAIGRRYWDNWLVYGARLRKACIVDVTETVLALHQAHDFSHHPGGVQGVWEGPEAKRNKELLGGERNLFTTMEATHTLTRAGLKIRCRSCYPVCSCAL